MSSASAPGKRICPECGHPNGGISLFCAECGASLNNAIVEDADTQATTAFMPVSAGQETGTWVGAQDSFDTAGFRPQADAETSAPTPAWQNSTSTRQDPVDTNPPNTFYESESRRGLVLGWIASLLIALVIGFFIWSSLLSQSFRDSVIGFF